jgi:Transcription elongation factor, GreA/GreB, C-term
LRLGVSLRLRLMIHSGRWPPLVCYEADLDRGQVSWLSPVARALMKAHQGDIVELRAPAGIEHIEVLAIRYGVADSKVG